MSYTISTPRVGFQPIGVTSTTQAHALGTIVTAVDPTYGEGEFIYAVGAASTAVGDVVVVDQFNGATTRVAHLGRGIVAVAMSANVATQYGWYQVYGAALVNASGGTVGSPAYLTATAGTVSTTVVATDKVDGMICTQAPASGQGVFELNGPQTSGNG